MNLKGKRVLYFDANKTSLTEGIKKSFERNGTSIDFITYDEFNDKRHGQTIRRMLNKIAYQKERDRKINDMFSYIKNKQYDIILIKAPFMIEHEFFQRLITYFPKTIKINYNWSPVESFNFLPYKEYFDKVYSFDYYDCNRYGLNYYPLFYLPEYEKIGLNNHKKYDISFVGSLSNKGRYEFFQNFIKHLNQEGFKHKFYLYSSNIKQNIKVLFTKPSMIRYIGSKFMPLNDIMKIMEKSTSIIDCKPDFQSGLTMRTFETLAACLLLFTTNENIKREPFYNPAKIKIIKSDLSDLNLECIGEFKPEWDSSFEAYSVNNWIKKITEY